MSEAVQLKRKTITGAGDGPHLLITGGVHGNEFEPMAAVRRLMRLIDPTELLGRVTLVPVVNEPAFERGERTADDGLDLARTCPGRPDGSITERVAHALSELIRAADYYIDLHTGGTVFRLIPLVGYCLHRNPEVLETQRRMARAFNLPIIWGTTPELDGRSLSVARDAKVPAIYAEWGGGGMCDPLGVSAYVDGCLDVLAELNMLDQPQRERQVEYFVEDHRPSSGHLQICNPSPLDGFYDPLVQLGDQVEAGEEIGQVSDCLGDTVQKVYTRQSGIVICLHTFRRVKKGDALAVVLEVDRPTGAPR